MKVGIQRPLIASLLIGLIALAAGCSSISEADDQPARPEVVSEKKFTGDARAPKSIFVFHDGTRNDANSGTNVRKLFDAVVTANDPQAVAMYIEGVGSASTPLLGAGLGFGMETRIRRGYDFISQSYRPGDAVYIFGFSRGAHSARALAGLIAYAGVPPASTLAPEHRQRQLNRIIEIVKDKDDADYLATWKSWTPAAGAPLAPQIRAAIGLSMQPVEIRFLGLWDTVPGSQLKKFGICKELPAWPKGDRYKSDSYPPIRTIFHALSIDEKRSQFRPILLCDPINPAYTSRTEVWFPGAHADVGGGYANSTELSNLSLHWMMAALRASGIALPAPAPSLANPLGLAHWSIGDAPGNFRSHCEDRILPAGAAPDPSVKQRTDAGSALLRINQVEGMHPYPTRCPAR